MRCKSCNVPLAPPIRHKTIDTDNGLVLVEEDFCNQCIYETEILDFIDIHTYQFEDITENILNLLSISELY